MTDEVSALPSRYVPTGKLGHSNIKFEASHPESAVPTAKLDVCDIKIVSANPDGVELIKVERSFLKNNTKTFPVGKFLVLPFFKKVAKNLNTN